MRAIILKNSLLAGVASLVWLTPMANAIPLPSGKGINVMTRYMKVFVTLENQLINAQHAGDKNTLSHLLSPFIEFNTADKKVLHLNDIVNQKSVDTQWHITQFKVYEVGKNAVAYFTLEDDAHHSRNVVDVWQPKGHDWQLRVRFAYK